MTHDAYGDEPWEAVEWLVRIDDLVRAADAKRQRQGGQ